MSARRSTDALARELQPLSLEQLLELVENGAQLLDTRDQAAFEGAHVRGALNIGLGGSFATWCGTILDYERPVVLVADPGREIEAATRLGRIGFDTVVGYLDGRDAASSTMPLTSSSGPNGSRPARLPSSSPPRQGRSWSMFARRRSGVWLTSTGL